MSKGAKKMNFSLRKVFPMQTLRPVQSPELTFENPTQCTPINPALGERRALGFAAQSVSFKEGACLKEYCRARLKKTPNFNSNSHVHT